MSIVFWIVGGAFVVIGVAVGLVCIGAGRQERQCWKP